jgi:DNA-binding beta-propeller fold protein YncE
MEELPMNRLALLVLIPLALASCESSSGLPPLPAGSLFHSPEGVAIAGDRVFVASTAFDGATMAYGDGTVTVVRRADLAAINEIPTSHKNPQVLAVSGGRLYVLCSGETSFDTTTYVVSPKSEAAIDVFDLGVIDVATAPTATIPIPLSTKNALVGYPSSLLVSADGRTAWAGSGTAGAIFKIDLAAGKLLRGGDDPIALGDLAVQDGVKLAAGPSGAVLAGSFNRDLVFAIGADDQPGALGWASLDVGKTGDMEGVQDLAWRATGTPDLFVLLGISESITSVATASGQAGVTTGFAKVGLYPNRLLLAGGRLLVVNSGDNNLAGVDAGTGASLGTLAAFPPNTNPYDVAVDGDTAYVTGFKSNTLFEVDLAGKAVVRELK